MEKAFDSCEWKTGEGGRQRLEVARQLGETSLMFLVHPTLKEGDMHFLVEQMAGAMKNIA